MGADCGKFGNICNKEAKEAETSDDAVTVWMSNRSFTMQPEALVARRQPTSECKSDEKDLVQIMHETDKRKLHRMLKSYEKAFSNEHNRQVSSYADIQPVANHYSRYKELKQAIASVTENKEKVSRI
jgi:hypothetical protein